jgi:hypothetical protein
VNNAENLKGLENYQQIYEKLEEKGWVPECVVGKNWVVPDVPRKGAARLALPLPSKPRI